ncbi:aldo/keto reductase [Roseivirga sp. BDSF3-8]|uniref:aldo/keto reductase n=1 Tax=Roseivirga sp. BDSF3-8 TaxID=3241598 RepID=UPI003531E2AA
MKFIEKQGVKIPALGFGTWTLKGAGGQEMIKHALKTGYRHIDTAKAYGNEADVGAAIKDAGCAREEVFVTTKIWHDRLAPADFREDFKDSLKKLQVEFTDLLLIHWPSTTDVPLEDTLEEMMKIKSEGLTRLIGVSNFPSELFRKASELTKGNIAVNQVEYHCFMDQSEVLEAVRENDALLTAYSPVGKGKVFGHELIQKIGKKYDKNEGQVALRWLMQQDNVAAIPRTSSKDHAESNFNIFDFELTADEMSDLNELQSKEGRLINPEFAPDWD